MFAKWICPMVILMLLVAALPAMAEPEAASSAAAADSLNAPGREASETAVPAVTYDLLPSLAKIGLSLVIIVVVIYLSVFGLKKLSGSRLGGANRGKTVQIIEHTYLAPKKSVCLLKMADRAVLIGITEANINLLTECDWEEIPEETRQSLRKVSNGFPGLLGEAAGKLFKIKTRRGGDDAKSV